MRSIKLCLLMPRHLAVSLCNRVRYLHLLFRSLCLAFSLYPPPSPPPINLITIFLTVSFTSIARSLILRVYLCVRSLLHFFHWQMQISEQIYDEVREPTKTHLEYWNSRAKIAVYFVLVLLLLCWVRENESNCFQWNVNDLCSLLRTNRYQMNDPIILHLFSNSIYVCILHIFLRAEQIIFICLH